MSQTIARVAALLAALAIIGCAANYREASGPELMANRRIEPLDVLVYRGSDADYDYFDRAAFKTHLRLKVRRGELTLPAELKPGDPAVQVELAKVAATKPD